jgi:competence protein ComEC
LRVTKVNTRRLPSPEGLRLTVYAPANVSFPIFACGQTVRGKVAMHTEEHFLDPGVWDASVWLRQQGVAALGSAHLLDVTATVTNRRPSVSCWLHSIQQMASNQLVDCRSEIVTTDAAGGV